MVRKGTGVGQLTNARSEILSNSRNGEKVFSRQGADLLGHVGERLGGVPIGPDLERIGSLNFEQARDLVEDACDFLIVHAVELPNFHT